MSDSSAFSKKKDISAFKIHTEHSVKELETLKHIQSPASVSGPEGDSPESSYKNQNKQKAHRSNFRRSNTSSKSRSGWTCPEMGQIYEEGKRKKINVKEKVLCQPGSCLV